MKNRTLLALGLSALLAVIPSGIYFVVNARAIMAEHDAQGGIALVFLFVVSLFYFGVSLVFWRALMELVFIARLRDRLPDAKRRCMVALVALVVSTSIAALVLTAHVQRKQLDAQLASSSEATLRSVYEKAASSPYDHRVMMRLAENPHCPPDILEKLALDQYSSVRYRVAFNPNTPTDLLTRFADDPDWIVRAWLSHNPATPPEIMLKLQQDRDENVRRTASYYSKQRGLMSFDK